MPVRNVGWLLQEQQLSGNQDSNSELTASNASNPILSKTQLLEINSIIQTLTRIQPVVD